MVLSGQAASAGSYVIFSADDDRAMNKSDIRLERAYRAKELRSWIPALLEISPTLARAFEDEVARIEDPGSRWDAYGATMMMGKVNGMTLCASILVDERMGREV